MNGFITGNETILFNDYNDLDLEVIGNKEVENIEAVKQISFGDFARDLKEEKADKKLKIKYKLEEQQSIQEKEIEEVSLENYKILNEEENLPPSQRLKNNIEAIKLLKNLERENRFAKKEEQKILAKYVGWGGLADVFDEEKEGQWLDARNFLKENLTGEEYNRACLLYTSPSPRDV